jgi:hypothetical protein
MSTATSIEKSAFVYLDDLLDNKEPIYVRNSAAKRGIVVVTLNDGVRTHREAIPNTKYPICLSNKATPAMIRNSRDLRTLLDRNILSLVAKDIAEKELARDGVKQALQDAYDRIGAGSSAVRKLRGTTEDEGDEIGTAPSDALMPNGKEKAFDPENIEDEAAETDYPDVQLRVQTLVESLINRDMKSRQVKGELMSMDLTKDDLAYIIDNTHGIVQKYAKERFAELEGKPLEDSDIEE